MVAVCSYWAELLIILLYNSHIIVGAGLPSPVQFNNVLWPLIAVTKEINEGGGSVKSDIIKQLYVMKLDTYNLNNVIILIIIIGNKMTYISDV